MSRQISHDYVRVAVPEEISQIWEQPVPQTSTAELGNWRNEEAVSAGRKTSPKKSKNKIPAGQRCFGQAKMDHARMKMDGMAARLQLFDEWKIEAGVHEKIPAQLPLSSTSIQTRRMHASADCRACLGPPGIFVGARQAEARLGVFCQLCGSRGWPPYRFCAHCGQCLSDPRVGSQLPNSSGCAPR